MISFKTQDGFDVTIHWKYENTTSTVNNGVRDSLIRKYKTDNKTTCIITFYDKNSADSTKYCAGVSRYHKDGNCKDTARRESMKKVLKIFRFAKNFRRQAWQEYIKHFLKSEQR